MPLIAIFKRPWADTLTVFLLASCICFAASASARPVKARLKPVQAPLTVTAAAFAAGTPLSDTKSSPATDAPF